ncbi:hypothetical protein [Candidatus Manganitrophus noduliformans]|uniref:Uncharacterized protein n=1 Tax=Candidatus Manganitrophus noduliformans TaxID=2606439 RepID=A0A7X6DNP6_9BACT|nr:hypothetical protein [Candidatus Manganitrophus noduliformans]NKE70520.1 hypothetical protein [Candidatus Manganitrophus noduliformans]
MKKSRRRDKPIKLYSFLGIFLLFFLSVNGLGGCGNVTEKKKVSSSRESKGSTLYVVNAGDGNLLAFDPPQNAANNLQSVLPQGNVSPSRRFPEGMTGPAGIFLDPTTDTLYVANAGQNAILIYENASTLNPSLGLAAATRTISGPNTGLNRPFAVIYRPQNGQLYVANTDDYRILIFDENCPGAPSALDGDIAPCRIISGASTLLDYPRGLALDTGRDILYVSDMGRNAVLAFNNISEPTTQGDVSPSRVITSHADAGQTESMLQLPFGLFIDSADDRLYVVKSGGNLPAIFIYETASLKGNTPAACASNPSLCGVAPERLLTTDFSALPPECNEASAPPECATTQLTNPAGIEVDVARSRIYVANNNNTNNVNVTGGKSTSSTALLVFNLKDADNNDRCAVTVTINSCSIPPDLRIGGDVTGDNETTLTNPVGIAVDMERDLFYLSNPTANNILVFSLEGNMVPSKINSGGNTQLQQPISFFYDSTMDRLYVANFNSTSVIPNTPNITVYDNVSSRFFLNSAPSWTITAPSSSDIQRPRAVYLDRTRGLLIILSGNTTDPKLQIYNIDTIPNFPLDSPPASAATIDLPAPIKTFTTTEGLHRPKAMAVDEGRGLVYIVNDCDANDQANCSSLQPDGNKIVVYNLNDLNLTAPVRTIGGTDTRLNRPFGVFIDTERDILYVTNTGSIGSTINSILAFHDASTTNGNIAPNRVISSPGGAAADEILSTPTAPAVNMDDDRLYLINRGNNSIYIYDSASGRDGALNPDRKIAGSATSLFFLGGPSGDGTDITGALLVDTSRGRERLFVGQPRDPTCPDSSLACVALRGAFLIFSPNGNVPPSRIWSGGGAPFFGPSAIALDGDVLYMASQGDPAVTGDETLSILTEASRVNTDGDPPLSVTIPALNNPAGLFVDPVQDRLYISNTSNDVPLTGTIVVIEGSPFVTGAGTLFSTELAPGDTIRIGTTLFTVSAVGSNTSLTLSAPYTGTTATGIVASRRICINTDPPCNAVLIFDNAGDLAAAAGPVTPDQILSNDALNTPRGLAVDLDRRVLYIANAGGDSVLIFRNLEALNGSVAFDAEIGGLGQPVAVAVDAANELLYVLDQETLEIKVFDQLSTLSGSVLPSPVRVISGGFMVQPSALFLDPQNDLLYVADQGANTVYIFTEASSAEGEAHHTTLAGNTTGLNRPVALSVDTTR